MWLTFAIREGKNREVRNVLRHLGLQVNRLIRVSFGPFQLGELPRAGRGGADATSARAARRAARGGGRGFFRAGGRSRAEAASAAAAPFPARASGAARRGRRCREPQRSGWPARVEGHDEKEVQRPRRGEGARPRSTSGKPHDRAAAPRNLPGKRGRIGEQAADAHRRRTVARARARRRRNRRRSGRPPTGCASRCSTS